jgi:hypothetical protein
MENLKGLLRYDAESGKLFWLPRDGNKSFNTRYAGREAITADSGNGYLVGDILGKKVYAHRVIFALCNGYWPSAIDHIDGNKANNRIENLRAVTAAENAQNCARSSSNKSGVTGVSLHKKLGKWQATITISGQSKYLGLFESVDAAAAARAQAAKNAGFHSNHGRTA